MYIQYTTYEIVVRYRWDEPKNIKNFAKHGIWFEEAQTVFTDQNALEIFDREHSDSEDRFIALGLSATPRLLAVVYCERSNGEVRIISSRKATKKEADDYEKGI